MIFQLKCYESRNTYRARAFFIFEQYRARACVCELNITTMQLDVICSDLPRQVDTHLHPQKEIYFFQ